MCALVDAQNVYLTIESKRSFQIDFHTESYIFDQHAPLLPFLQHIQNKVQFLWKAGVNANMKRRVNERGMRKGQRKREKSGVFFLISPKRAGLHMR